MSAAVTPAKAGALARRLAAAAAGAAAAVLLAWGAWVGLDATLALPVKRVVFAGELERLARPELDALAQAVMAAPSMSLQAIREASRRVPWVRDATVRRLFPDAIEITFTAHTAFARWNDAHLVSPEGEVFSATGAGALPQLRGPDGSAPQLVREFGEVAAALAPVGVVAELRLSPRGAWHAVLESGLAVALGRGDWRPRVERFAAAWPRLPEEARAASYADLRYPGGFALKRAAKVTLPPAPTLSPALPQGGGRTE
jgi:cell division protein FtsQ